MQLALYQPDIPQNLGSLLRLCACLDTPCHIIEPCGFILDDKRLKRVAMDYAHLANIQRHISWEAFFAYAQEQQPRVILLSTKGSKSLYDFTFHPSDLLLLGRESAGVPQKVANSAHEILHIPLASHARSLNIGQAASMALGEALRQIKK